MKPETRARIERAAAAAALRLDREQLAMDGAYASCGRSVWIIPPDGIRPFSAIVTAIDARNDGGLTSVTLTLEVQP